MGVSDIGWSQEGKDVGWDCWVYIGHAISTPIVLIELWNMK